MAALKFKNKHTGEYDPINTIDKAICKLWNVPYDKKEYAKPKSEEDIKRENPDLKSILIEFEYHAQINWFDRLYMCTADKTLQELKDEYISFFDEYKNHPEYNEWISNNKEIQFFNYMIDNYIPISV